MMNKIFIIGLIVLFFGSISFAQNNRQNDSLINFVDINNNKQGKWEKKYPNGQVRYRGFFVDNIPTGVFTYYYQNGKIKSVLNYDESGGSKAELFWDNGNYAAKGYFDSNNNKHLTWHMYFEDGKKSAVINFNHGVAEGNVLIFYQNIEKLALNCNYKAGKLDGQYTKYFQSGAKMEEGTYKNGTRDGYWKFYSNSGMIDEEGMYVNGKKDGEWKIYRDNPKGEIVNYDKGVPDNWDELMEEWRAKEEWAKENQNKFKQPEDYFDNPIEFFKPSTDPNTQVEYKLK
jgi:antitoxin component YwqK of YwqJK toxin-antitoxin module